MDALDGFAAFGKVAVEFPKLDVVAKKYAAIAKLEVVIKKYAAIAKFEVLALLVAKHHKFFI